MRQIHTNYTHTHTHTHTHIQGGTMFDGLIPECMARLGTSPLLISAVGSDVNGRNIISHLKDLHMVRVCPSVCVYQFVCVSECV